MEENITTTDDSTVEAVINEVEETEQKVETKQEKQMSLAKTLKRLEAEAVEHAELMVARDERIVELEAGLASMVEEHSSAMVAKDAEIDELRIEGEEQRKGSAQLVEDLEQAEVVAEDAEAEKEELAEAVAHNPALAQAAAEGAEAAEDCVEEEIVVEQTMWQQLSAIEAPAARTKFWKENKAAIEAEMKESK